MLSPARQVDALFATYFEAMGGMSAVMSGDFSHRIPNAREVMLKKMVPLMDPDWCVRTNNPRRLSRIR